MKLPTTLKGYLKLLLQIADSDIAILKGMSDDDSDWKFLSNIKADIQNDLGEDEYGTMERNKLKWKG